ncbi:pyridoxamine 5'-phosphate oxidase family protein [Algoriphagus namhaensis]
MSSPEHKQLIWNIIKEIKVGMLVTIDGEEKALRGRPMSLVQEEYDGSLYFFTSKEDAKWYEVAENRNVCLTFSNSKDQTYVSLSGQAKLTDNAELIDRYWNDWVAAWFPKGKQDPSLAMLEVKISSGEHWVNDENKLTQFYKLVKATVNEEQPEIGENEKFG